LLSLVIKRLQIINYYEDDMKALTFYAPISKTDDDKRMVYGYASTEAVDSQGEVVKKDAIAAAIDDYMKFANIREMHQASAVGKAKQATVDAKGLYLAAKVVDDVAWNKVKEGVYNGFSIGGRVKTMIGNEITGLSLSEISLVDRPANPEAIFDVWKLDDIKNNNRAKTPKKDDMAKPEVKKSLIDVARLAAITDDLNWLEDCMEMDAKYNPNGDMTNANAIKDHVNGLLETLKAMIDTEATAINAEEKDEVMTPSAVVEDAAKATTVKKQDEQPVKPDAKPHGTEEQAVVVNTDPEKAAPVVEVATTPVVKPVVPADVPLNPEVTPKDVPVVTPKVDEKPELKAEPKDEPKAKTAKNEVEEAVKAYKMPTDDQLLAMMKEMDIKVIPGSVDAIKMAMADEILKGISESREAQANKDATILEAKKVLAEAEKQVKKITPAEQIELLKKAEGMIDNLTKEMAAKPAETVNNSPAEAGTPELPALQRLVELLAQGNSDHALTEADKEELKNGIKASSTIFGTGHWDYVESEAKPIAPVGEVKADDATNLKKLDETMQKLDALQKLNDELNAEVKRLSDLPLAIKAKVNYSLAKRGTDDTDSELEAAEAKLNEMSMEIKKSPNDQALIKRSVDQANLVMKLRREAKK
jgi:phage head maturation protease